MENITSLKEFKEAKVVLPHIQGILKIFDLSIRSLKIFDCYVSAQVVVGVIKEQEMILKLHEKKYLKILTEGRSK